MGTHGEGPNAIKWATPAYLRRVREEHKKAYDEIKKKMGDKPFIFGRDPDECMLALIDKWNSEEEENARIAAEELEVKSDVFSFVRLDGLRKDEKLSKDPQIYWDKWRRKKSSR